MENHTLESRILDLLAGHDDTPWDFVAIFIKLNTAPGGHYTGAVDEKELHSTLFDLYQKALIRADPAPAATSVPHWPPETKFRLAGGSNCPLLVFAPVPAMPSSKP